MRTLMLAVMVSAVVMVSIFLYKNKEMAVTQAGPEIIPQVVTQISAPDSDVVQDFSFPFAELTIPYLRSRTYHSQLGELRQYQDRPTYTSFLTSYDSDGLRVNGLLTRPKGEMPPGGWPAVVFVHGYIPPTLYRTTERYLEHVDYLARNGFVVFKIDLRGHGDSEGTPSGAYMSGDYIIDTLNAYAALQNTDFVNADKIGLWGHSMAGNVTMRSLAVKPDIPAVVIWGGAVFTYTDRIKYGISDNSYRPPTTNTQLQQRRRELMVTPANYLGEITGAIQLNHAVNDDVVNVGYSRDLNALLDQTSVVHELQEYPSGGHNISGAYFTQAMQNTVRFYKEHLN
jgi:dipeptidyl aminopeptidase/acylaminoacyl peptidase